MKKSKIGVWRSVTEKVTLDKDLRGYREGTVQYLDSKEFSRQKAWQVQRPKLGGWGRGER